MTARCARNGNVGAHRGTTEIDDVVAIGSGCGLLGHGDRAGTRRVPNAVLADSEVRLQLMMVY